MDWITLLTAISGVLMAFGGLELIKWLANRRSNNRQSEAEADRAAAEAEHAEVKAEHDEFEYLRQRIDFKEQQLIRAEEREADKTAQIRKLTGELIEMTKRAMIAEQRLQYETMWRCEKTDCEERRPPNPLLRGLRYAPEPPKLIEQHKQNN